MDIVIGALIALVSGVVIPFLTTQFSLWSDRKRAIISARRAALDHYEETTARVEMKHLAEHPSGGVMYEIGVANDADRQAAFVRLAAQFSLKDEAVYELWAWHPKTRSTGLVMASWANGQNRDARRAALRLIEVSEREKRELRQPEAQAADPAGGEAE